MLILCIMLKSLRRPDVLLSNLLTFKLTRRGLLTYLPATLLILTDCNVRMIPTSLCHHLITLWAI